MALTSDDLITRVLRRCFWPATNAPLSSADILAIADEEIEGRIWPEIIGKHGDYYVSALDHRITVDYSRYRLPARLYGPVRDVLLVDSDGVETSIPAVTLEELGRGEELGGSASGYHHYYDGDHVGLYPVPDSTVDTLRIRYFRAPSKLALGATCTTINTVNLVADNDTFTVLANPAAWVAGSDIDIISAGNAHQILAEDVDIASVVSLTINTTLSLAGSGIRSGDHVATAGLTPIVQVPDFMLPWLVLRVAAAALRVNDPQNAEVLQREAEQMERATGSVGQRSRAEPMTHVARNSPYKRVGAVWRS